MAERGQEAHEHRAELLRSRTTGIQEDVGSPEVETSRRDRKNDFGPRRIGRQEDG